MADTLFQILYLAAFLTIVSCIWGIFINGVKNTFFKSLYLRKPYPINGWKFWAYGLSTYLTLVILNFLVFGITW
jgi:hypothetical protein